MKFQEVLKALADHKGDGVWEEVAKRAGVHYDTVARIARGKMKRPSVVLVEKIAEALLTLFPPKGRRAADRKAEEAA